MAFWGVEVKVGESIKVEPGVESFIHLSMACLVNVNKDNKKDTVYLYVYTGNQKLCIGTLSGVKFPQIVFDLVFDKEFEIAHTSKSGSVHLCGYRSNISQHNSEDIGDIAAKGHKHEVALKPTDPLNDDSADSSDSNSSNEEDTPIAKEDSSEEDDSDDSSDSESSDEDTPIANKDGNKEDHSDDSSDADSSDEEETPIAMKDSSEEDDNDDEDETDDDDESNKEKLTQSNKRGNVSVHISVPAKKAKFVTPPKMDSKTSGGHVATPYPSKQLVKAAGNSDASKQHSQKTGEFRCNPCNRTFGSDNALQSHSKAKHGVK